MWTHVHIITRLELGGAQLATLHQARHSAFSLAPRYLIYGPGGLLDAEAQSLPGVVCLPVAALSRAIAPTDDAAALLGIARHLRALRRPGRRLLVHTHSSKAGILGRLAARAVGAHLIVHSIHGFGHQPHEQPAWVWRPLWLAEWAAAHVTDGFTADSAANLTRGRQESIITRQPACVVHCGVDTAAFATPQVAPLAVRRALNIPAQHQVVLQVGCLKTQKDPLAFVALCEAFGARPVTFLLAGDGALRPDVERAIARLPQPENFRLLGWRRDVGDLLHACDVLVLTSLWEGLPQVFGQAMAAGKPIVATDVDGAPEAIEDGRTGYLVAPRDPQALAARVRAVLDDDALRASMGALARLRAPKLSQESMVQTLDQFYAALAARSFV